MVVEAEMKKHTVDVEEVPFGSRLRLLMLLPKKKKEKQFYPKGVVLAKKKKQDQQTDRKKKLHRKNKSKFTKSCDEDHKCSSGHHFHLVTIPGNDAI